jgi:large subunit ribosomal protein L6
MSRIGKKPVPIPSGVTVEESGGQVKVKGPKGELAMQVRPEVGVAIEGGEVVVTTTSHVREASAYHGLTRALINNMVEGVTSGYQKILEIHGVGWNAEVRGRAVALNVGYANIILVPIPDGVEVECPNPELIMVRGIDKQAVGQLAAVIRSKKKTEPYKGKGIRYRGEHIRQKAGKTFGS